MVFDKFKEIKPERSDKNAVLSTVDTGDADFISGLGLLKTKKKNRKWLVILSETAAAVVIVVAVTLWALLGRAFREENPSVGGQTDKNTYYAMVDNLEVINGKAQVQAFFDDYMNGKPCKLDIFGVESINEEGIAIGHSTVYDMKEDGSGSVYCMAANDGTYTAFEGAQYIDENYQMSPDNPAVTNMLQFSFFSDGMDYISYSDSGGVSSDGLDLSFIENNYDNSDILYVHDKAKALVIKDGKITDGKEELFRFLRLYHSGNAALLKIEGDEPMFIENSWSSVQMSCSADTEEAHGLVLYMETDVLAGTVKLQLKKERTLGELYKEIVTLDFNEVYEQGLFFDTSAIGHSDYITELYDYLVKYEQMKLTQELVSMLKATPPAPVDAEHTELADVRLSFKTGLDINLYRNDDGTLSNIVGLEFPLYPELQISFMEINDDILTVIEDALAQKTGKEDIDPADAAHTVVYNNTQIVEGQSSFQSFFDDYVNGKECSVKLKEINENGNKIYYTVEAEPDGSVRFYGDPDPYYDYKSASERYDCDSIRFILLEGSNIISYISFHGEKDTFVTPFDLNFLTNDHPNSDRVYDYDKARKTGNALDEFKSFAKHYWSGIPCAYKFENGGVVVFDGKKIKYTYSDNSYWHEDSSVTWELEDGKYSFYLSIERTGERIAMIKGVDEITVDELGIVTDVVAEQ